MKLKALSNLKISKPEVVSLLVLTTIATYWPQLIFFCTVIPAGEIVKKNYQLYFFKLMTVFSSTFLAIVVWYQILNINLVNTVPDGVVSNSSLQVAFILRSPFRFFLVIIRSIKEQLFLWTQESIGVLGWMTLYLPAWTYLAWLFFVLWLIYFCADKSNDMFLLPSIPIVASVFSFLSIMFILFVTSTSPGQGVVSVFQGRYLIPLFFFLVVALFFRKNELSLIESSRYKLVINSCIVSLLVTTDVTAVLSLKTRYWN